MKIAIDLNAVMNQFKPWDLTLTIDSTDRKVRPMTLADVKKIQGFKDAPEADVYTFINEALDAKDQPVKSEEWEHAKVAAVLAAIQTYYGELLGKNSQVAAAQVKDLIADATK